MQRERARIRDGAAPDDDDDDHDDDLVGERVLLELREFENMLNQLPCNPCKGGYMRFRRDLQTGTEIKTYSTLFRLPRDDRRIEQLSTNM